MSFFKNLSSLFSSVKAPQSKTRDADQQREIERKTEHLTLYYFPTCPFCIKVRATAHRYGLPIRGKNINRDPEARNELLAGSSKTMVPCLRIDGDHESTWLYESADIVRYLRTL